jgi:hypothetical protein
MGFYRGPKIVTDGLVLYLDAANTKSYDGTTTTVNDLSGNGNNATLINGVGFTTDNNGAFVFDGANDYGVLGITSGLNFQDITFTVIAKIPQNDRAALLYIFNRSGYLCVGNFAGGIIGPPNGESFSIINGTPFGQSFIGGGEYIFMDNLYHDFTFTRINNTDTFYVDGISVGAVNNSFSNNIPTQLYPIEIGQRINSPYFSTFTASIYKIYNRALTPEEVFQNYNATKSRYI